MTTRTIALAWLIFCVTTFSTVGLKIDFYSSAETEKLVSDLSNSLVSLLPANVFATVKLNDSLVFSNWTDTNLQVVYELIFKANYDSSKDLYEGSWFDKDGRTLYSCVYSPKEERPYFEFVRECVHLPLEMASFWLLKNDKFEKYLRLTYHPAIDEYGTFSPDGKYFAFITDRLAGNRDIALFDLAEGSLRILPISGSSEYFPRFSPDGKRIAFQGSLHGFWNVYTMTLEDHSRNIVLLSAGDAPAYAPNWLDENTIIYVQDTEQGNSLFTATLGRRRTKLTLPENFDMVFSPVAYKGSIYFVGLKDSNFGIYALTVDRQIVEVEDSRFNEHDPAVSPDGRYLAYASNVTGYYTIWVKDLISGEKKCVTEDIPHDAFYPTFSADGKYIVFSVYEGRFEPDIWFVRFTTFSSE